MTLSEKQYFSLPDHLKVYFEKGKNTHCTVKSIFLMEYLIRMVTQPGGTVLDPFMGSGTTGVAAIKNGFNFIGIEKEEEYFKICQERITSLCESVGCGISSCNP